ncbi:flagellar hook assembly protein FlgD [Kineosporia sp. A_224]|uniref:flagellar hook assembly protein FlgD n=1 Tax=Kineosporia sp. A_224 TaxID=1962180 RepID=UPI000B4BD314|nr:flagellar hook capping FlgD N-terminal domain-containing protein [Kineosporia sp. A_224]
MTSIQALAAVRTALAATSTTGTTKNDGPVGTVGVKESAKTDATNVLGGLDSDVFLKLLVAQMKYQDPTNPTDSTAMLAQTAQYTVVEKLSELSKLDQKVLDASNAQSAASMLGRTVTWKDVSGNSHTGVVTATSWGSTTPNLSVGTSTFSLDDVTSVATTPDPASTTASAT